MSALVNPDGPPGLLARAAREKRFEIVSSWDLAQELIDVLARPKLRRYEFLPEDERAILVLLGRSLPSIELEVQPRDPDDVVVVAAAVVSQADVIVTGDRGVIEDADLRAWLDERGIEVLTPAELVDRLG